MVRLIEEAAGVSQYKNQKISTIRKLEVTKSNLDRVKDIIAEIEANVKNLNLQMKRFERHKTLLEKIKTKSKEMTDANAWNMEQQVVMGEYLCPFGADRRWEIEAAAAAQERANRLESNN